MGCNTMSFRLVHSGMEVVTGKMRSRLYRLSSNMIESIKHPSRSITGASAFSIY